MKLGNKGIGILAILGIVWLVQTSLGVVANVLLKIIKDPVPIESCRSKESGKFVSCDNFTALLDEAIDETDIELQDEIKRLGL